MGAAPLGGSAHSQRPHGVAWVSLGLGGVLGVLALVMSGVLAPVAVVDRGADPAPVAVGEPGPGAPGAGSGSGGSGAGPGGGSGSGSGTGDSGSPGGSGGASGGPPPDVGGPGVPPPTLTDPDPPVVPGPLPVDPDHLGPWLAGTGLPDGLVALGLACREGDAGACVTFTRWLRDTCAGGDRRACLVLERAISGPRVASDLDVTVERPRPGATREPTAGPAREPVADPLVRPHAPSR